MEDRALDGVALCAGRKHVHLAFELAYDLGVVLGFKFLRAGVDARNGLRRLQ